MEGKIVMKEICGGGQVENPNFYNENMTTYFGLINKTHSLEG